MKTNFKHQMVNLAVKISTRYRYLVFMLILILIAISYLGLEKLEVDSSNETFFAKDDPIIVNNNEFKKIFGNEEFIFILIESNEIFSHDVLDKIKQLSNDLEENIPFCKEVTSLTNLEYMETEGYNLVINNLIGEHIPEDEEKLNEIKEKALSKKSYVDTIISKDTKKTGIIITFENIPEYVYLPVKKGFTPLDQSNWSAEKIIMKSDIFNEEDSKLTKVYDPRKLITPALKVILNRHQDNSIKITASGIPILDYETEKVISDESAKFGLIALIVCVILMILIFKNLRAAIGPFFVIFITLLILYGSMGWFGVPVSITSIIIPTLILVISVSYSIHIINHFQNKFRENGSRLEAIKYIYKQATWPIFITTITTALGFVSFIAVPIKPIKDLGIFCALGVFVTYLLVMILIPSILSLRKDRTDKDQKFIDLERDNSKFMVKWANFVVDNSLITTVISILLVTIFISFTVKMPLSSDFIKIIGDDVKVVKDSKYVTEKLGALYSYEVLIDFPEENMAKEAKVLKSIDEMSNMIDNLELTYNISGLNDIIKEINKTMHENNEDYYKIPDSNNLIAQYLLLYEMSGGEEIENFVDFTYKKIDLSVQVNDFNIELEKDFDKIITYAQEHLPKGTKVTVVGDVPIMLKMLSRLVEGQAKSVIIALIVITIIMIIVLKSVKLGLLSMLPNTLPIIVVTGLMGILQYPLDLLTILIAPMIIGIAVDDTVHYFIHFKKEYESNNSYIEANKQTFKKIGKALVFTSIILMFGFSIFSLSKIESMTHLGILSVAGIFSALLADMLITPAIFIFLKPLNNKNDVSM